MHDARAAMEQALQALEKLEHYAARNICAHEETYRGGAIWEICRDCGMKWADDEGGRPPYVDPPELVAAGESIASLRAALAARPLPPSLASLTRPADGRINAIPMPFAARPLPQTADTISIVRALQQAVTAELETRVERRIAEAIRRAGLSLLKTADGYEVRKVGPATAQAAARPLPVRGEPQWLPIETAPKDGRTVLLGHFNSRGKWRTLRGQWFSEDAIAESWEEPDGCDEGWYETSVESEDLPNCWLTEPTHWMALPAAPSPDTPAQPGDEVPSNVSLPLYQAVQWNHAVLCAEREPFEPVVLEGRTVVAVHKALLNAAQAGTGKGE